jgi:hypothetical protein
MRDIITDPKVGARLVVLLLVRCDVGGTLEVAATMFGSQFEGQGTVSSKTGTPRPVPAASNSLPRHGDVRPRQWRTHLEPSELAADAV